MLNLKSRQQSWLVVFIHGLLGFNQIRVLSFRIEYFRRLGDAVRGQAVLIDVPSLPPVGSVTERAEALATRLASHRAQRLILIAHSMGGLDARCLIRNFDPDHRVRCLITLCTPHRGTPVARWLLQAHGILPRYARRHWSKALADLTPEVCHQRNSVLADREDVLYLSFASRRSVSDQPLWLRPFGRIIGLEEGENDGLVSVASARWGDFQGIERADHLETIGWSLALPSKQTERPFPHIPFLQRVLHKALTVSGATAASGTTEDTSGHHRRPDNRES
jgi:triacylglycerol lipase